MRARCQDSSDGVIIASFSLIWLGHSLQCCMEIAWRCLRDGHVFLFCFSPFASHFVCFLTYRGGNNVEHRFTNAFFVYFLLLLSLSFYTLKCICPYIDFKKDFEIYISPHFLFTSFRDNQWLFFWKSCFIPHFLVLEVKGFKGLEFWNWPKIICGKHT